MNLTKILCQKIQHLKYPKVIVAVSGGPDSVALLYLLKDSKADLVVAHFNHKLRGRESDADEKFVQAITQKLKLPFITDSAKVQAFARRQKMNLEEAARTLRYEFLRKVQSPPPLREPGSTEVTTRSEGSLFDSRELLTAERSEPRTADPLPCREGEDKVVIAVAHARDDQIETILFNLMRGAGESGSVGMDELSSDGLWRPLLEVPKEDLLKYLKNRKIAFRQDRTNQDLDFTRNFLRLEVLPLLRKNNPKVEENILRFAKQSQKAQKDILRATEDFFTCIQDITYLPAKKFLDLSGLVQGAVLREVWKYLHGSVNGFEKVRAEEVIRLAKKNIGGKKICFGEFWVKLRKGMLIFSPTIKIAKNEQKGKIICD